MSIFSAIVLAGGSGTRMHSDVPKQCINLMGAPLITYALRTFSQSKVDEIVFVVPKGEEEAYYRDFVEKYHIEKVTKVIGGGEERYHSVYQGLLQAKGDYVLIHDGARPFVTEEMINQSIEAVQTDRACVVAVPVKDTMKRAADDGFALETIDRNQLYQIQTPQTFEKQLLLEAYQCILKEIEFGREMIVTDDAMMIELATQVPVRLIEGSYTNIKITTPEDLIFGEAILKHLQKN